MRKGRLRSSRNFTVGFFMAYLSHVSPFVCRPWSSFSLMVEFLECGDSSPHGSESGDESPRPTFGGLNDDQGPILCTCINIYLVLDSWGDLQIGFLTNHHPQFY